MITKLAARRCFWILFPIFLVACSQQAMPTVDVTDTALATALPTFVHITPRTGPTFTPDPSLPPALIFFSPTPYIGPIPTYTPTNVFPTITPAPTRTLVPLPFQMLEGLRVAYIIGGNLYVQDSGKQTVQLTHGGHDYGPIFSRDGQKIVFYRGENQLWGINADGTGEQALITPARLAAFGEIYTNEFMQLHTLMFAPGAHQLLFNTHIHRGRFDPPKLNNDLFFVDTDTAEIKQLRAPEQGGNFLVSPDGKRIAVQTQDHIDVIDLQGQIVRQNLVTYPMYNPPAKVPMVWMPNSRELIVLPSQFDPSTSGIPILRQVWRYPLDGSTRRKIRLDPPPIGDAFSISPDGNWIAYSYEPNELDPNAKAGVYLGNLRDGTSQLIFMPPLDKATGYPETLPLNYEAWSPNSVYFSCHYDEIYIGNIHGEFTSLGLLRGQEKIPAWIDGDRYLLDEGSILVQVGKQERVRVVELPSGVNQPSNFVFLEP